MKHNMTQRFKMFNVRQLRAENENKGGEMEFASHMLMVSMFQISFKDYYKKQYDVNIQDLEQPLLLNRMKTRIRGQKDVCMNSDIWVCLDAGSTGV
jgi:hypothetical protein